MEDFDGHAVARRPKLFNAGWRTARPFERKSGLREAAARGMIGAMQTPAPSLNVYRAQPVVTFTRQELARILSVYGHFVAAGEWRDYGLDHLKDRAVFSIFRRAAEVPVFRIEKHPKLAERQGAYMVVSMTGAILRRGKDIEHVLRAFDRARLKLASD